MGKLNVEPRTMFCHDNLEILQGMSSECIDLIYLDPPFNKKKVFTAPIGSAAEGAEFSDIFEEKDIKDEWVKSIEYEVPELYSYLFGVKTFSNIYNYCYLVYMTIRLIECQRILKDTGSIYLHCDPTMSHYLKIMMDCIFGENNFRNEIVWCYTGPSNSPRWFPRKHDILLFYVKSQSAPFNQVRIPYKHLSIQHAEAREGGIGGNLTPDTVGDYLQRGKVPEDYWLEYRDGMTPVGRSSRERTGYPTQKPLALLERIIKASSNRGDIVLDPFCGCATTCVAAEKWGRKWIGIDVSEKAYELVNDRIQKQIYGLQKPKSEATLASTTESVAAPLLEGYERAIFTTKVPKRSRDEKQEQGYVYIISNSNWQGIYKVGIAKDPQRRLNSYQTSDPFRAYKLEYKIKTQHYREVEKRIHEKFNASSEWITSDFKTIKSAIIACEKKCRK